MTQNVPEKAAVSQTLEEARRSVLQEIKDKGITVDTEMRVDYKSKLRAVGFYHGVSQEQNGILIGSKKINSREAQKVTTVAFLDIAFVTNLHSEIIYPKEPTPVPIPADVQAA